MDLRALLRAAAAPLATAVLLSSAGCGKPTVAPAPAPPAPITVRVEQLTDREVAQDLALSGTVRSRRSAVIATRVSGLVKDIPVEEGDRVTAGQMLAQVDVSAVAAQADAARSGVEVASAGVRETEEGVTRAQAAIGSADARIRVLQAQRVEATAAEKQAASDRKRAVWLFKEDALSRADLEKAETGLAVAQARVSSIDAGIEAAKAERSQAQAAIGQANASVTRSRAQVSAAQSGVAAASSDLAYGTLRAPFDGAVTRKLAHVGDLATPGRALLQIEDVDRLHVDVEVPEDSLKAFHLGQTVPVRIGALSKSLEGRVYQVVPSADPQTRTFVVKVALPADRDVLPGVYAKVPAGMGTRHVVLVPKSALLERGQLTNVFVVDDQQVARLRLVRTVPHDDKSVQAISGLESGARIVVSPSVDLADGTPVRVEGGR